MNSGAGISGRKSKSLDKYKGIEIYNGSGYKVEPHSAMISMKSVIASRFTTFETFPSKHWSNYSLWKQYPAGKNAKIDCVLWLVDLRSFWINE